MSSAIVTVILDNDILYLYLKKCKDSIFFFIITNVRQFHRHKFNSTIHVNAEHRITRHDDGDIIGQHTATIRNVRGRTNEMEITDILRCRTRCLPPPRIVGLIDTHRWLALTQNTIFFAGLSKCCSKMLVIYYVCHL